MHGAASLCLLHVQSCQMSVEALSCGIMLCVRLRFEYIKMAA